MQPIMAAKDHIPLLVYLTSPHLTFPCISLPDPASPPTQEYPTPRSPSRPLAKPLPPPPAPDFTFLPRPLPHKWRRRTS